MTTWIGGIAASVRDAAIRARAAHPLGALALAFVAVIVPSMDARAQAEGGPVAQSDDRAEQAEQLFERSEFAAAADAFAARFRSRQDDARLAYNLALARWRAGDAEGAETAAEQAATLSSGALAPLRDGILGNLRFDAARAILASTEPPPDLQAALASAKQAVTSFRRGALAGAEPQPTLARNLERALALVDEIQRRIDEQQKEEQDDKDGEPDPDAKSDEQKPSDDSKDPKPGEDGEQSPDENSAEQPKPAEQPEPAEQPRPNEDEPSEPRPEEDPNDESKSESDPSTESQPQEPEAPSPPSEDESKPQPNEQPSAAEQQSPPLQLSEAQKQRLLQQLEALEQQRIELRKAQAQRRPRTERDW